MRKTKAAIEAWVWGYAASLFAWATTPCWAASPPSGPVTFNKDIAPVVFAHCAPCHRPGQSGPFDLLSFTSVRKHAEDIAGLVERRLMPPWMPDPGPPNFLEERRLKPAEMALFRRWLDGGCVEGVSSDLPPPPMFKEGWQLGVPDQVVTLAAPYSLAASGPDQYRNFVVPLGLKNRRFLRGFEFRARGKAIHHAFVRFDRTDGSRKADASDPGPGFGGIHMPKSVENPLGQFLSWQPGKQASVATDELVSAIEKSADLVLQLHLQPTGREESVQPEIGLYFGDKPPTKIAYKIPLGSMEIDIPAGAKAHAVTDSFTLPVEVEIRAILPHAHYLASSVRARATLPGGTAQTILSISRWDFNWQGDYRYATPIILPKGSRVDLEIIYDNSSDNPRNRNNPPKRVQYGSDSTDEMAELWLQVVLRSAEDMEALTEKLAPRFLKDTLVFNRYVIRKDPGNWLAHNELGLAHLLGNDHEAALREFQTALGLKPDFDEAYYQIGVLFRTQNRPKDAERSFREALRINPANSRALGNLGLILLEQQRVREAKQHFLKAMQIDPDDPVAREMLDLIRRFEKGK